MTSRAKKTYGKKDKKLSDSKMNENENEKENIYSRLRTRKKVTYEDTLNIDEPKKNLDDQFDKLCSSPIKQEVDMKPLGFWSKKLQDLNKQKNTPKKKHGLYEFSGTDESLSPSIKKKKLRQKPGVKKKPQQQQQQPKFNLNFNQLPKKSNKSKMKKSHEKSLLQERILLNREKKKLADKDEKLTFSTTMSSLGVTSTPAPNKYNLVGASNFMFLSPVIKEEESECMGENNSQQVPLKLNHKKLCDEPVCAKEKTPKRETNLSAINCRRVLRTRRKKTEVDK